MDRGNHYQKCDLQVHTPRDRGWKGGNCNSDEERKAYAKMFIKECRAAGLNAVAITDHHDMVFYEYINEAAGDEVDESGDPITVENKIVVFPGIELTLHQPPIQGLLIFDADFPESLFPTVLGSLSLAQAPKLDSKTSETQPIPSDTIDSINDIYSKLNATDGVKGRYIFLPHVKDGGHKTLMRKGFHEAYAKMPSVGGYVDGSFESEGTGYIKIINGEVAEWGFKSIAVIQTSDYRADKTLSDLNVATWIKWREPTAEALRQAFLAKESRISLTEPDIPNVYIEKIDVTNSSFLSKFDLNFNPQLNSIIGGRGSGKSTILEYLRWALCDQTEVFGNDDAKSDIERKRSGLIEKTLKEVGGEVRVFFLVNGTRHIIKRNPSAEDVSLKVGDEDFQSVRPQQIRDILPIQAYSQKQLSTISIRLDELKRFIEQPISKEIEEIGGRIEDASKAVKSSYERLSKSKILGSELKKTGVEINSLKKQIGELRSGLKGISDEDKKIINQAKLYANEKNRFDEVELEYSTILSNLQTLINTVKKYSTDALDSEIEYENENNINGLNAERTYYLSSFISKLEELDVHHSKSEAKINALRQDWENIKEAFESKYKAAKEKSSSSKSTLTSIEVLEDKIEKLDLSIRQKKSQLSEIDITDEEFNEIYKDYVNLQISKTDKLKASTELFTTLSDGFINADFSKTIDADKLGADTKLVFSAYSLNIPKAKSEQLANLISTWDHPVKKWHEVVFEIKSLSEFNLLPDAQDELPHTPILDNAGFTVANKRKISEGLSDEGFLNFATIKLEFFPKFYYRTQNEMGDEIPFEDASAGQQATALLNVLLNQEGFPPHY